MAQESTLKVFKIIGPKGDRLNLDTAGVVNSETGKTLSRILDDYGKIIADLQAQMARLIVKS